MLIIIEMKDDNNEPIESILYRISQKLTIKHDVKFDNNKYLHSLSKLLRENPDISEEMLLKYGVTQKLREIKELSVFNIRDNFFHPLILKNLTSVQNLMISSSGKYCHTLSNINFLSSFKALKQLKIHHVSLADQDSLKPLSLLFELRSLDIQDCQIKDLSPISKLPLLTNIRCNSNNLEYIPSMLYAKRLIAYDNPLKTADNIGECPKLEYLVISRCEITDIGNLENYPKLHSIYCVGNKIKDISCVDQLADLKTFIADDNQIQSINVQRKKTKLQTLSLRYNEISSIKEICKNFPNLTFLALSNNKISNILDIIDCECLKYLDLRNNLITNPKPIYELKNLKTLDISKNPIKKY